MTNDQAPAAESSSAAMDPNPPPGPHRLHRSDEPTRPLASKAAALHGRRQRIASARAAARLRCRSSDSMPLTSDDGAVTYLIKPTPYGVYVERTQRRPFDAHVIQGMVFDTLDAFVRWCESDPIRFDHPVLYSQLRRQGDEVFSTKR